MSEDRELRFLWRDALMGPAGKSVSSGSELRVAHWIADHIHAGEIDCFPTLPTLIKETGLGRSTAIEAISSLEKKGWLGSKQGTGRRATRYWMLIPADALAMLPAVLVERFGAYFAEIQTKYNLHRGVQTSGPQDDVEGSRHLDLRGPEVRTPGVQTSDSSGPDVWTRTIKELENLQRSEQRDIEAMAPAEPDRQPGNFDMEGKSEDRILPLPDIKAMKWAWGSSWPSADQLLPPYPTIVHARTNVGYEASRLLGYTLESAKTYHHAHGEFPGATIIEAMGAVMHEDLASRMHAGNLRKVDLASVLGSLGFEPIGGRGEAAQTSEKVEAL